MIQHGPVQKRLTKVALWAMAIEYRVGLEERYPQAMLRHLNARYPSIEAKWLYIVHTSLSLGLLGGWSRWSAFWTGIINLSQIEPSQLIVVTSYDTHTNHIL